MAPHPSVATVVSSTWISPSMVRVVFAAALHPDALHADSYIKLRFDGVPRAYTVRSYADGEMTIDFVVHGDQGLAGPWAASASPGDELELTGPGGAWSPRPSASLNLFIGDESALPAIASGLERLGGAPALVVAEVAGPGEEYPLPVDATWVYRDGAPYGVRLVETVLALPRLAGDLEVFLHGNAEMVRPLRRHLLGEWGLARERLSASGYWRAGHTDEAWRAGKREFNAAMEQDLPA